MSEGNLPPRSQDADALDAAQGQLPLQADAQLVSDDDWETVRLMGMPPLNSPEARESAPPPPAGRGAREAELQSRIADLNHCNEVLLSRINQLEETLERSQQALQQEVERSQRSPEEDKVVAAQNRSVAQLLSELDTANESLKRQTLLAETLAAQLKTAEERADRLEKECAILRKRKSERAKQLQASEETCADLRSRLQRQQQYTLQFKAALEKCLDTSAFQHTSDRIENDSNHAPDVRADTAVTPLHTVGMPRSESIRPWSASSAQVSTDPQLQLLMRLPAATPQNQGQPSPSVASADTSHSANPAESSPVAKSAADSDFAPPPFSSPPSQVDVLTTVLPGAEMVADDSAPVLSSEAEQQLWQDVERVFENNAKVTAAESVDLQTDADDEPAESLTTASNSSEPPSAAEFTEPIPWGAPIRAEQPDVMTDEAPSSTDPLIPAAKTEEPPVPSVSTPRSSDAPAAAPAPAYATSIPALDAMQTEQKSPSPLVHPLRPPQRKRKSLSAVELPSFPPLPKVPHG